MHARRGFERAYRAGDARGGTVLALVQRLYVVERQAPEAALSAEARLGLRLDKSAPIYAEFFDLLETWAPPLSRCWRRLPGSRGGGRDRGR